MLTQAFIFLLAAVLLVPVCSRLGLGAVLGYLAAGIAIGPFALGLIADVEEVLHFSEFGVVLLLFVIGLELQPSRLWVLRRLVFGLGAAQVLVVGGALALLAAAFGLRWQAALVAGLGLAMSSTALVIQTLSERKQLTARHGRDAFAILLFQDLAVIPLLALLPLLSLRGGDHHILPDWHEAAKAVLIIAATVIVSRTLVRPLFRAVSRFGGRDLFTAAALLLVIGTALLLDWAGLSMSLGAFLAGMLLADSEYRHELEAVVGPFKGLFLGLFFIAVGMTANLGLLIEEPGRVLVLVALLVGVKAVALFIIARLFGAPWAVARRLALALAQGGEFAFVLFALAENYAIFDRYTGDLLLVVVTLSMLLSPLLFVLDERLLSRWFDRREEPAYDPIDATPMPVVIAGFGRFGQVVSRVLYSRGIAFTALDSNARQVDFVRRFGGSVFYGDSSRLDVLDAARVGQARLLVLAIEDVEQSLRTAALMRRYFPRVPVYARARDRVHACQLMDLGVKLVVRETLHSSVELSRGVLAALGFGTDEAERTLAAFLEFDEQLLRQQRAIYQDEAKMIESNREVADQLRSLFEAAERDIKPPRPAE